MNLHCINLFKMETEAARTNAVEVIATQPGTFEKQMQVSKKNDF